MTDYRNKPDLTIWSHQSIYYEFGLQEQSKIPGETPIGMERTYKLNTERSQPDCEVTALNITLPFHACKLSWITYTE